MRICGLGPPAFQGQRWAGLPQPALVAAATGDGCPLRGCPGRFEQADVDVLLRERGNVLLITALAVVDHGPEQAPKAHPDIAVEAGNLHGEGGTMQDKRELLQADQHPVFGTVQHGHRCSRDIRNGAPPGQCGHRQGGGERFEVKGNRTEDSLRPITAGADRLATTSRPASARAVADRRRLSRQDCFIWTFCPPCRKATEDEKELPSESEGTRGYRVSARVEPPGGQASRRTGRGQVRTPRTGRQPARRSRDRCHGTTGAGPRTW